ncbi:cytochrome b562 [Crenobacter sp. SG2305]|uniref:cytochrome b562 n=1 Tax=Crenobacter oryzisoli TaxID=3056844 RepID=UPI0025AAED5A|nr:cytochrome b562 [Crenobacter sp. SG2305]MDN0082559.1 cytochrome b562 [Crenobacter sp. SG2305]
MVALHRTRNRQFKALAATAALVLLSLSPMAGAGEIKNLMKDMKVSVRGAMASNSMPEFSKYFARLQNDVQQASKQQYRSDPATYHEGMQQLQKELIVVEQAVKTNNLQAAKDALQKTNQTKKHYHDLLN